jgi:hypothetical protein
MKALNWSRAMYLADSLRPDGEPVVTQKEAESYASAMQSYSAVNTVLGVYEATEADMLVIRSMLACELATQCREKVLYRLINAHETLMKRRRVAYIYEDLPALAVFAERNNAPHAHRKATPPSKTTVQGLDLQAAVTGALHGR